MCFSRVGTSPVEREVSLTTMDYLAFAASGAACTSLVRTALVPLDVAKTLMQSSPEAYPALRPAIASLWAEGGLPSLYRSVDVTAVAGFLLGGFGFGVNEFLRRCTQARGPCSACPLCASPSATACSTPACSTPARSTVLH